MRIWLINPFDPLPGDPEQEGRYATLVRMLRDAGHSVVWWTSSFSHRFKKPVDQKAIQNVCQEIGIDVRFLDSPAYPGNVTLRRLWNHYILAKRFQHQAKHTSPQPQVVIASAPPPMLAKAACRFAKSCGAKCIVDIQDLWPETFHRLVPKPIRPTAKLAFSHWAWASKRAYELSDAVVGVADAYVEHGVRQGGSKDFTATIPLGIDLDHFDAAAKDGICEEYTKPEDEVWLAYTGSLNRSYDPLTIIRAAAELRNHPQKLRLFITGRGELQAQAEQIIRDENLKNVTLTGFLSFPQWAYLLSQCDIGFNASFPEAHIYLPNKIFYYLAAELSVINTIPGQCSRIVSQGECGCDYTAGDVASCRDAIQHVLSDRERMKQMQSNARKLATDEYDRKLLYTNYVKLIEDICQ